MFTMTNSDGHVVSVSTPRELSYWAGLGFVVQGSTYDAAMDILTGALNNYVPPNAANSGVGNDAVIASLVSASGTATATALKAAFVPRWQPSTAYASGALVLSPTGQIVQANSTFTSGASYSASNWTVVAGGGSGSSSQRVTADGLALTEPDGGTDWLSRFRYAPRADPYFFPLALYMPPITSAARFTTDAAAGINCYHHVLGTSDLSLLVGAGVPAILQASTWLASYATWKDNAAVIGVALDDERDMAGGGPAYTDPSAQYVAQQAQLDSITADGRFVAGNYSKGVTFYNSDSIAARWVNGFQDLVSADVYWMTDPLTWGQYQGGKLINGSTADLTSAQGRLGYHYGLVVQRLRSLIAPAASKPVWNIIELAHQSSDDTAPTPTAAEIKSAAWHSIIAGARGLVFFNYQFQSGGQTDGDVITNQPTVRTALGTTNALITKLAPVLNAPSVTGFCTVPAGVAATVRYWRGAYYLIAGSRLTTSQSAAFTINVAGFTSAEVIGESRTVTLSNSVLADTFADKDAVHIYKLAKG